MQVVIVWYYKPFYRSEFTNRCTKQNPSSENPLHHVHGSERHRRTCSRAATCFRNSPTSRQQSNGRLGWSLHITRRRLASFTARGEGDARG